MATVKLCIPLTNLYTQYNTVGTYAAPYVLARVPLARVPPGPGPGRGPRPGAQCIYMHIYIYIYIYIQVARVPRLFYLEQEESRDIRKKDRVGERGKDEIR